MGIMCPFQRKIDEYYLFASLQPEPDLREIDGCFRLDDSAMENNSKKVNKNLIFLCHSHSRRKVLNFSCASKKVVPAKL